MVTTPAARSRIAPRSGSSRAARAAGHLGGRRLLDATSGNTGISRAGGGFGFGVTSCCRRTPASSARRSSRPTAPSWCSPTDGRHGPRHCDCQAMCEREPERWYYADRYSNDRAGAPTSTAPRPDFGAERTPADTSCRARDERHFRRCVALLGGRVAARGASRSPTRRTTGSGPQAHADRVTPAIYDPALAHKPRGEHRVKKWCCAWHAKDCSPACRRARRCRDVRRAPRWSCVCHNITGRRPEVSEPAALRARCEFGALGGHDRARPWVLDAIRRHGEDAYPKNAAAWCSVASGQRAPDRRRRAAREFTARRAPAPLPDHPRRLPRRRSRSHRARARARRLLPFTPRPPGPAVGV